MKYPNRRQSSSIFSPTCSVILTVSSACLIRVSILNTKNLVAKAVVISKDVSESAFNVAQATEVLTARSNEAVILPVQADILAVQPLRCPRLVKICLYQEQVRLLESDIASNITTRKIANRFIENIHIIPQAGAPSFRMPLTLFLFLPFSAPLFQALPFSPLLFGASSLLSFPASSPLLLWAFCPSYNDGR